MKRSENIDQLAAALAAAQGEFTEAIKDGKGNYGKHATLTSVREASRMPLCKHGLAILQSPFVQDGRVHITTLLTHKSGQWVETELSIRPARDDAQAIGSAITYGRRYSLAPLLGIVNDEDDDGSAAIGKDTQGRPLPEADPNKATFTNSPKQVIGAVGMPKHTEKHKLIFNAADPKLKAWVVKKFDEKSIAEDSRAAMLKDLEGKDLLTELEAIIDKALCGEY